ncbi:hypothetical protein [Saccharopolyspora sp. 5N708]|uniref:hypothetical protein n=1 Tax=Saccharopolyspora sp. 5N708 TaxID=3457424 RepID=UPI003FD32F9A
MNVGAVESSSASACVTPTRHGHEWRLRRAERAPRGGLGIGARQRQRRWRRPGHSFESEREGEAVNKTTPDLETPIFRELHDELGELPELDIHDFDQHAFDFLREYDEQKSTVEETPAEPEPVAASAGTGSRRGGRRRKGD